MAGKSTSELFGKRYESKKERKKERKGRMRREKEHCG